MICTLERLTPTDTNSGFVVTGDAAVREDRDDGDSGPGGAVGQRAPGQEGAE